MPRVLPLLAACAALGIGAVAEAQQGRPQPPGPPPTAGRPAAERPPAAQRGGLDVRIPQLRLDAVALSDAIDLLREAGRLNLRVDWQALEQAGIDRSTPVTLFLRNVTVRRALDAVLREAGAGQKLAWDVVDGIVEVTTQEEADKRLVTEVYDVRDLLFTPLDAGEPPQVEFNLEPVERGGGGGGGQGLFGGGTAGQGQQPALTPEQRGQQLVELITSTIRPEVWDINGGTATIRFFNGMLIVSAPRSVHQLLGTPVRP
ncbi:MAG: hypothetical protein ACK4PI_01935 [Tepidisphaerales bacterium]